MEKEQKIVFDFGEVRFIRRSQSKAIRISINPRTGISVVVPPYCSDEKAINFVIEKEAWIRKSLAKVAKTINRLTVFDESSSFSTFSHKLVLQKHDRNTLKMGVTNSQLIVKYPAEVDTRHEKVQEFVRNAILRVLHFEAKNHLPQRTRHLAEKHGLPVNEIKVRNNKTRWGSCSGNNNINLNIHLMRLPNELIDYVIFHELAHIKVKNHSKTYWQYLETLLPGAKLLDKQLNNYHLVYW